MFLAMAPGSVTPSPRDDVDDYDAEGQTGQSVHGVVTLQKTGEEGSCGIGRRWRHIGDAVRGCSRAVTTRMASTSRNSGVSSFPTHVKILPGRREKNSTAAKNTQENAASSTVALTFSPSSGSMPTVKDVEAQRGMAEEGTDGQVQSSR